MTSCSAEIFGMWVYQILTGYYLPKYTANTDSKITLLVVEPLA